MLVIQLNDSCLSQELICTACNFASDYVNYSWFKNIVVVGHLLTLCLFQHLPKHYRAMSPNIVLRDLVPLPICAYT